MIGLGRMGGNMARRLLHGGHRIVVYDRDADAMAAAAAAGGATAPSTPALVHQLAPPRAVWLMLPAGPVTDAVMDELAGLLAPGDAIIDGGNANYKDTMRRGENLAALGIHLLDAGTSGGVWGLVNGYALMVGGPADAYRRLEPVFQTLAPAPDPGLGPRGPHRRRPLHQNGA